MGALLLAMLLDVSNAPSCIGGNGKLACGFLCVQSSGRVACADTPLGACGWRFGELRCWDPAPEVRWAMEADDDLQPAECERTLSHVACGYHCVSTLDEIRCAATPWGQCVRRFDQLACWDPAPTLQAATTVDRC